MLVYHGGARNLADGIDIPGGVGVVFRAYALQFRPLTGPARAVSIAGSGAGPDPVISGIVYVVRSMCEPRIPQTGIQVIRQLIAIQVLQLLIGLLDGEAVVQGVLLQVVLVEQIGS